MLSIYKNQAKLHYSNFRHFSHSQKKVVITSPIFYVNAQPHIGHLYTAILCDAMARYHRLNGDDVFLSTGTDEHGMKIQKRALEEGKDTQVFCDHYSDQFKRLFNMAHIQYDRFIRTTEEEHQQAVKAFWNELKEKGCIKEGKHTGYYSVNEESFFAEKDLIKDQLTGDYRTESGEKVELIDEKNYVFEITPQMRTVIREWAQSSDTSNTIVPDSIKAKILSELDMRKDEISVSRPTERIHWGIRVPGDDSQTIYVWLDALVNYITVLGYPDKMEGKGSEHLIHVVGKDIAKFHCMYWPAFLLGAQMPLPKQVLNHGHWLKNKMKMSKSLGNVEDPFKLIESYGINSVRSYFLSEGPLVKDSNFELDNLIEHHNKVICDSYINMLFRITGKKILKTKSIISLSSRKHLNLELISHLNSLSLKVQEQFSLYNFIVAFDFLKEILYLGNQYLSESQFWSVTDDEEKLDTILFTTFEVIRMVSILMQPYCPEVTGKIMGFIGVPQNQRTFKQAQINEESLKRKIVFDVEKKDSIFINKIETEEEKAQNMQKQENKQGKGKKKK